MSEEKDDCSYVALPRFEFPKGAEAKTPNIPIESLGMTAGAALQLGLAVIGLMHFGAHVAIPKEAKFNPNSARLLEAFSHALSILQGKPAEPSSIITPGRNGNGIV